MTRILMAGCSGMMGFAFTTEALNRGHTILGTYYKNPVHYKSAHVVRADLRNYTAAKELALGFKPDWIVNCVGYTSVDGCEENPESSVELNEYIPQVLAEVCHKNGIKLVHISSDMVFDGWLEFPLSYSETHAPHPINVYGKSKLIAETLIHKEAPHCLIIRTNIFGWSLPGNHSLPEIILHTLDRGEIFRGFVDVFSTPILTNDLANIILDMMDKDMVGLYHIGGADRLSKFSFASMTAGVFGYPTNTIQPISIDDVKLTARRPTNMCLSSREVETQLNISVPTVEAGLWRMKEIESTHWYNQFLGGTNK